MGRMHVAHLEAGALAREAAGSERRETPLVRDLGERVGLIHELRELRGAEELAHRGRRGLGVDQILRHHSVDVDRRHALLDGALHAQQAQPILVLHQFADRSDAAIAEMVDVVDFAAAVAQIDERLHHGENILAAQRAHRVRRVEVEAHVHLHAADGREVVALRVEEQRMEHRFRRVHRRRLARSHHAIDVEQRFFAAGVLVDRKRVADIRTDVDVVDVENGKLVEALLQQQRQSLDGDLVSGFGENLARARIEKIIRRDIGRKALPPRRGSP